MPNSTLANHPLTTLAETALTILECRSGHPACSLTAIAHSLVPSGHHAREFRKIRSRMDWLRFLFSIAPSPLDNLSNPDCMDCQRP